MTESKRYFKLKGVFYRKILLVLVASLIFASSAGIAEAKNKVVRPVGSKAVQASPSPTPSFSPSPSPITSFEVFWPITAGKVEGESMYWLKRIKEKISGKLIFSETKKSKYRLTLSKKRLLEAEKLLLDKKDYPRAQNTLSESTKELQKSVQSVLKAKEDGKNVNDLNSEINETGQKESDFLKDLISKVPQEQQQNLINTSKSIEEILKALENK